MIAALFLLLQVGLSGNAGLNGFATNQPVISAVSASVSATTVVLEWTTSIASDSRGYCGSEGAVDAGFAAASTSHEIIVAGLVSSTLYSCTVVSGSTSAQLNVTTNAAATTTPITGLSYGSWTDYNSTSPPNQFNGDTYTNCESNDGNLYFVTDDVYNGFNGTQSSAVALAVNTGLSPFRANNVNSLSAYGDCCSSYTGDGLSPKAQGIWCQSGNIYLAIQRTNETGNYEPQYAGSIIASPDYGAHWNNFQNPGGSYANGAEMTPTGATFFPGNSPSNFATNTFVMYGADDGTNGYLVADNRVDNADAYIYQVAAAQSGGGSAYDNNDAYYLIRVPRAKIGRLNASDYQFYTGSGGNGALDAAWSPSASAAVAILSASQALSVANVQYIPALNRYLLLTFYFPTGGLNNYNSVQVGYEAPHPWGPWTLINSTASPSLGWYNQYVLQNQALAATFGSTTMTVLSSQNFRNASQYTLFYTTLTVTH